MRDHYDCFVSIWSSILSQSMSRKLRRFALLECRSLCRLAVKRKMIHHYSAVFFERGCIAQSVYHASPCAFSRAQCVPVCLVDSLCFQLPGRLGSWTISYASLDMWLHVDWHKYWPTGIVAGQGWKEGCWCPIAELGIQLCLEATELRIQGSGIQER